MQLLHPVVHSWFRFCQDSEVLAQLLSGLPPAISKSDSAPRNIRNIRSGFHQDRLHAEDWARQATSIVDWEDNGFDQAGRGETFLSLSNILAKKVRLQHRKRHAHTTDKGKAVGSMQKVLPSIRLKLEQVDRLTGVRGNRGGNRRFFSAAAGPEEGWGFGHAEDHESL